MNPLKLQEIRRIPSVQAKSTKGDKDLRQTTISRHIEKFDEFVLGLFGERRAIRVACPRVQAFLSEIRAFWGHEQQRTMRLARHRRRSRHAIFRKDVLETRFQLGGSVKRDVASNNTRPIAHLLRDRAVVVEELGVWLGMIASALSRGRFGRPWAWRLYT